MRRSFRWVLGVGAVFAAAECVMGQVGVSPGNTVDPNPPAIPQSATGLTTTFAIQYFANVAGLDKRIFFSCAGSGGITTTGCPAAQFLTSGAAPTTVTVTFSSGAAGAGWLTIRADTVTPVGAAATTGRRDFAVVSPAASLIALAPTASTVYRGVGSAGAESYVLTNTGQLTSTYTIASVAASCTGVLTGCVIAPSSTPALAPNGVQQLDLSYSASAPGVQTLTVAASVGGSTVASLPLTVNVLSAALSPASASSTVTTSGAAQTYGGFTLVNASGSPAMSVQLTASCTGVVTACVFDNGLSTKTVSLGAGAAPGVSVSYIASTAGTGTLSVAAISNGVTLGGATLNVTAQPPPVVVSLEPPNPTATWTAGATTRTYTGFILSNEAGSPATTIQMDLTCAILTTCQFANVSSTTSVALAAGPVSSPFNVTYLAPTAGAGTLRVDAKVAGGPVLATRTLNVTVQAAAAANFAPATASTTVTTSASAQTYSGFTLTNAAGSPATTIILSLPTCSGVTTCLFSNGQSTLNYTLAVGEVLAVPISFVASAVGAGQIVVRATAGGTQLSQATLNVTAESLVSAAITPSAPAVTVTALPTAQSYGGFVLTNGPGSPAATVVLDIPTCNGVLTTCLFSTGTATRTVSLAANGGTQTVGVTYIAATGGTGTLLVRAMVGTTQLSTAALTVTAQTPMATLLPASPAMTVTTGAGTQTYSGFTLTNAPGSPASTFDLTISCTLVTTCVFSNGLTSIPYTLAVSGTQNVPVTFVAPTAGAGTVSVTVSSGGVALTSAVLNVTAQAPAAVAATLTPATAALTVTTGAATQTYSSFTLTNAPGSPAATIDLSFTACTGVATCRFSNGLATLSTSLAVNGALLVPVSFVAATAGTGTVTVRAAFGATTLATATLTVTAQAGGTSMIVVTQNLTTDSLLYRDECVALSLGSAIASECGDLRVMHALPAVRTLNVTRAPMLVYSSAAARAVTIVPADLTLPASLTLTAPVTAALKVGGVTIASGSWPANGWTPGSTRRATLRIDNLADGRPIGVYPYVLEVTITTNSGSTTSSAGGQFVAMNVATGLFGAGWGLAGIERLDLTNGARLLWYNGDGDFRVYTQRAGSVAPNRVWGAPSASYPDSIREGAGSTYIRQLPDSVSVTFGSIGEHRTTRNAKGHVTTFVYDAFGRPSQIAVPPDPVATALKWTFNYGANGLLASITAPGDPTSRTVTVHLNAATFRIDSITDPGTPTRTVKFTYGTGNLMTSRINGRNVVTRFQYDSSLHVARASLILPGDSISRAITNWQAFGLSGAAAADTSLIRVALAGPRAGQLTTFRLNKFGAPRRVVSMVSATDSLVTSVSRTNATYPTLVTQSVSPTNYVVDATYDGRGRLLTQASLGTSGTMDTTRYTWDLKWDAVLVARNPEGDSTVFSIDAATGNRLWQQDARGTPSRTTFTYDPVTNQPASVTTPGSPPQSFEYGTRGNLSRRLNEVDKSWFWFGNGIGLDTLATVPYGPTPPIANGPVETTRFLYSQRNELLRQVHFAAKISDTVETAFDAEGNALTIRRGSAPNPQFLSSQTSTLTYDNADRPVKKCESSGGCDSTVFDAAGNAITAITRRGQAIGMGYDWLGRLTDRSIPTDNSWVYPANGSVTPATGPETLPFVSPLRPAEVQRYTYHASGQILTATALDADVIRSYHPSGALLGETLNVRDRARATIAHTYTLDYAYDRDGRRTARTVGPTSLFTGAPMRTYYANWGAIDSVTDIAGNRFGFTYNVKSELIATTYPGGVRQTRSYDILGRDSTDRLVRPGSTAFPFFGDTLLRAFAVSKRNGRGQIITAADASSLSGAVPSANYDSVGHLVKSKIVQTGYASIAGTAAQYVAGDTLTYDGLGNILTSRNTWQLGTTSSTEFTQNTYNVTTGRLASRTQQAPTTTSTAQLTYDAVGNTRFEVTSRADATVASQRASYYGADDRLLAVDLRTPGKQLLEEYRYDALGRRIWVSTRWRCAPSSDFACVANAVTRTVWDGASEVAEVRARYDTTNAAAEELDAGAPLVSQSIVGDANPFYGRVVYGPALALDQPLSVTRYEYRDNPSGLTAQAWPTFTLVPFWDYRGTPAVGVFSDGAAWQPFGSGATACAPLGTGTTNRCVSLTWPFAGSAYDQDRGLVQTVSWHGSLLRKRREASGLTYIRNRMYDPGTGRFTQEDPIGLAGGLNAYGFAGGDPVNYSDPFGLCPDPNDRVCAFAVSLGQQLRPAQRPLEIAGTIATAPLAGGMGMAGGAMTTLGIGGRAALSGTALARALGATGEAAAGLVKNTERIPSATGTAAFRVPDGLTATTLSEVKNVGKLSLTNQLRDFAAFAQQTGRTFELHVRSSTALTGPLQQFIMNNNILLRTLR